MNDLNDVARQARMLMTAHGVGRLPFEFDRGLKRIAAMHYVTINGHHIPKKITMSRHFAEILTMDEIRDCILHEIAHALAPDDNHGPKWRTMAIKVGANPSRTHTASARPEKAWKGSCPSCNKMVMQAHRPPQKVRICNSSSCRHLDQTERILDWSKNGVPVSDRDMPAAYFAMLNRVLLNKAFSEVG